METTTQTVETPKEITELGEALGGIMDATGVALADGFQAGTDIPVILTAALLKLSVAIEGISNVPEEFKAAPVMATMGVLLPVARGVETIIANVKK